MRLKQMFSSSSQKCFDWNQKKDITTQMPLHCIPIVVYSIFLHHQKNPNHPCSG